MLQGFWFGLIAVLWAGFFVLEGFDFGVGMLLPFVARSERERDVALRTIGPVWDGNEVWLIVAGGATFAAFPEWYASVFSGFYLAFALLLVGLILRGIGIEYRGKARTASGRRWCEWAVVIGSLLPALLLGVAFADFLRGVQMNRDHVVTGGFFDLLTPYALLGGLATLSLFAFHGALFLTLRSDGPVAVAAHRYARPLAVASVLTVVGFLAWSSQLRGGIVSQILAVVMVLALVAAIRAMLIGRHGWAFAASAAVAGLVPVWVFACLWPDVLPAHNGSAFTLTVQAASASPYTLRVMTVVALIFTPIVPAYQAWTYWVFRARVGIAVPTTDAHSTLDRARDTAKHAAERFDGVRTHGGPAPDDT